MNNKILLSILSIFAVIGLVGGITYAYFNDTGTSTNNVFSTGTLDLVLSDNNETDIDSVTASFGGTNLAPGGCLASATLNIKNVGSVTANYIDISATNDDTLANYLKLKTLTLDGLDVRPTDTNLNGFSDLDDLKTNGIVNKALIDKNTDHPLVMEVCLDISTPNEQQGHTDTLGLSVFLDQGPHL